jgi:hypothetical protein
MTLHTLRSALLAGMFASLPTMPAVAGSPADLRLNEIQLLGTHNSYHLEPRPTLLATLLAFDPQFEAWEYSHLALDTQFALQGIRQIELDVFADPDGGLYSVRHGLIAISENPNSGLPELDQPGFKVLHVQDLDFETTCLTLVDCLQTVKSWSDANPAHLPIMILIEAKDDPIDDPLSLGFVVPIPIGSAEFDDLDAEIRSVFPEEQMITPDDVRGTRPTLEAAILRNGWPTLREARGKVLFALDNGGAKRDAYVAGHPSLEGRVMFTNSPPGDPEAAFIKLNDPVTDGALIAQRVEEGYIVRTRADADTQQARTGDTTRRDAALASGAQFVSSDYPDPDPDFGTGYFVEIPGGAPAGCNPVNGPSDCDAATLENLTGLQELEGKKLVVRDKDGDPSKRRIVALSKDRLVDTPLPGTLDDPRTAGATVELLNPVTLESASFILPPGINWKGLGKPAGLKGYRYLDLNGEHGPCKVLLARAGKLLKAVCLGKNGLIPFDLNEEPGQGSLIVRIRLGGAPLQCMEFGGNVTQDKPAANGKVGLFKANDSGAGGCP